MLFTVNASPSQVESLVTSRPQERRVNQHIPEERTYLEIIDDYEDHPYQYSMTNEELHYHEIRDATVQEDETVGVRSEEQTSNVFNKTPYQSLNSATREMPTDSAPVYVKLRTNDTIL